MELEKAKEYIRMILRQKQLPDSAKALEYVYATDAIETLLQELDNSVPKNKLDELVKEMRKDGSNYWADRIEEKMNKEEIEKCLR